MTFHWGAKKDWIDKSIRKSSFCKGLCAVIPFCFFPLAGSGHAQQAENLPPVPVASPKNTLPLNVPKIFNGEDAEVGQFPWVVSIGGVGGPSETHQCTGSILSEKWILTAAHCFTYIVADKIELINLSVYAIQYGVVELEAYEKRSAIKAIYVPKDISVPTAEGGDIALVELTAPLILDGFAAAAIEILPENRFPEVYNDDMNQEYVIMGFGVEFAGDSSNSILLHAKSGPLSKPLCDSSDVYDGRIKVDMMCVGDIHDINEPSACKGDSGGPVVWSPAAEEGSSDEGDPKKQYLTGVASWQDNPANGFGCAPDTKKIQVYIQAPLYREQILACMNGDECSLKKYSG